MFYLSEQYKYIIVGSKVMVILPEEENWLVCQDIYFCLVRCIFCETVIYMNRALNILKGHINSASMRWSKKSH